jgi:hypothetical protein
MADPGYIVDNVLTDGEAWVAIATAAPSSADVSFVSTDDGQVGDFSQYMDLVIVGYWQSAGGGTSHVVYMNFNNDTGSNYAWQYLRGNGAATDAYGNASGTASQVGQVRQAGGGANIFSAAVINIFDINSGKYKSVLSYAAADWDGSGGADMDATTWKSQAPITEIDLTTSSGFSAGTRIDLFGVLPRMVA